jgi:signal transduction histidine kinase
VDELYSGDARYANLAIIRTNGEVLASATGPAGSMTQGDRQFFQRVIEAGDFVVGNFPVNRTIGKQVINFGYPVFDRFGQIQAVVLAVLDLDWFSRVSGEFLSQLGRGAVWQEIDSKGTILLHFPNPQKWIGRSLPAPFLKSILPRSRGILERQDSDGISRFYAYSAVQNQFGSANIVSLLGIPKQTLFAAADQALIRSLTWFGVAMAIACILGWVGSNFLILRPIKALVGSSARLASGDLSARTGLPHGRDELGRLTLTFDLMAQALEQRELDRRRATHKLQVLSQRLVEVQESERRSIARELHDEIGQTLTVAEMNLQAALNSPQTGPIERRLADSIEAVGRVQEQVHDLSLNLRPSMLDDLGLEPALRWYTNRQASLTGIKAEFRAEPLERRIDAIIETECFRIGQEALTNVIRHSKARNVTVELKQRNGQLHLIVRDDGLGFDVESVREQAVHGASLGLLSMEERAALAGGGLEFHSAPGKGTEIRAWFPLKWQG